MYNGSSKDTLNLLIKKIESEDSNNPDSIIYKCYHACVDDSLEDAIREDNEYQEVRKKAYKKAIKIDRNHFSKEQWEIIDDTLCANNHISSEYGRVSYYQGFKDALNYLAGIFHNT